MQRLGSYRLIEKITDYGGITYHAVDENSKESVFVHLVPGVVEPQLRALMSKQKAISRGLLDVQKERAQLYVITKVIPDFVSFSDWLHNASTPESQVTADTVDKAIDNFQFPEPGVKPSLPPPRTDEVAKLFRPSVTPATVMRGQKPESHIPRQPFPAPPIGPDPYDLFVEQKRKNQAEPPADAQVGRKGATPKSPASASNAKLVKRIGMLEAEVSALKILALVACLGVGISLILIVFLFFRNR